MRSSNRNVQREEKEDRENMTMYYQIRVKGHLDKKWREWFEPLAITNVENGEALLVGELVDQAALYGVLIRVRDLGLPLIAVHQAHGSRGDGNCDDVTPGEE